MRNKFLHITIIFLAISAYLLAHPIKMTTGKLQINTIEKTCLLTLNFFIDDFESEMRKIYPQPPFDYDKPDDIMKGTITDYILTNIEFSIDKNSIKLSLNSIEQIESNVFQITFKGDIKKISAFNLATIKNTLLFSSFSKQSNILHFIVDTNSTQILQFYPSAPVRKVKFPK